MVLGCWVPGATKLGYWRLGYSDTGGSDTGGLEATRLAGQGLEAWGDCWLVGVGDWLCSHTLDALERSADYYHIATITMNMQIWLL